MSGYVKALDPSHPKVMPIPFSGCWIWLGKTDRRGYGRLKFRNSRQEGFAHRAAWEQHVGPIPEGLHVCHKCDVRPCVNPAHLFVGTNDDNVADCISKGRQAKGMGHGRRKLSEDQVRTILEDQRRPFEIARDYDIHRMSVVLIKRRHSWRCLEA